MTTKIEWTRGEDGSPGMTLNATTGCDKVSPGCGLPRPGSDDEQTGRTGGCYALTMAGRLKLMGQPKYQNDGDPRTSGPGFGLTLHPDVLDEPLRRKKPTTWFVNSMSDLWHEDVPESFIADLYAVMALTPRHTFQILTKRSKRMARVTGDFDRWMELLDAAMMRRNGTIFAEVVPSSCYPMPWVWQGVSIENDAYAFRANHLRQAGAAVRFISYEPAIGPVPSLDLTGIDWLICGAESGRGARPMDLGWVREIRDRCQAQGVAFFLKQLADDTGHKITTPELDGRRWTEMPQRTVLGEQARLIP